MKTIITLSLLLISAVVFAQNPPTYQQSDYANANSANIYYTVSPSLIVDYASTGENFTWDFSAIAGVSQREVDFGNVDFLTNFIFFGNNADLTYNVPFEIGGLNLLDFVPALNEIKGVYDINGGLNQIGVQVDTDVLPIPLSVSNADPELFVNFPIVYNDTYTDTSSITIGIPNQLSIVINSSKSFEVDGWGTVTTPYATYNNAIRVKTDIDYNFEITLSGQDPIQVPVTLRNYSWYDSSEHTQVLSVNQTPIEGTSQWANTAVEYLDQQRDFQSIALFFYAPVPGEVNETVTFTNTSINAVNYSWDFDDPSSGANNTSTAENPTHVFQSAGVYNVTLTASNSSFSADFTLPVIIEDSTLSLTDNTLAAKFKVYPNPFSSTISFNKEFSKTTVFSLYNVLGKEVFKGNAIYNVDFSYLNAGTYILKINDNGNIETVRLIKE